MPRRPAPPTLADAGRRLAERGFSVTTLRDGKLMARNYGCAAVLAATEKSGVEIAAAPGIVLQGELARLVDRGYQKFFKTAGAETPALPEQMAALARFDTELRYACGIPSLYNEGLGSVSDRYLYDRIVNRDEGRQPKAWEDDAAAVPRPA